MKKFSSLNTPIGKSEIMAKLPEWLLAELPKPKDPALLAYKDEKYHVVPPHGEEKVFDIIDDAYDYIKKDLQLDVEFDKSLPEYKDYGLLTGKRTKSGIRALISFTDDSRLKKLEREYEYFLKIAKEYEDNPNSFEICYKFVNMHPAFWNRPSENNPWQWETYGHCAGHEGRLSLEAFFHEDGTYVWKIETGEHIYPEYNKRYYDYRLDAYGNTVEEAFIDLARLINKFFNVDGTQKEDVPHIKPKWVLEIEKDRKTKK